MWARGDQVVFRYRNHERITAAIPMMVVEDSPSLVALFVPAETPLKRRVLLDGSPWPRAIPYEEQTALPWRMGDGVMHEHSILQLTRPGAAHSIWLMWRGGDWSFRRWYINLQTPLRRTPVGFDTRDQVLDMVVLPDLSWHWKDEDEFAAAQRIGRFTPEEAAAIRAEGETAIAAVKQRAWPFDASWNEWRPDPAWPVPTLPEGWDLD